MNRKAGWGDPLIAGRYHYDFGNGLGLTAYGDIGGFGIGAHTDWQVIGTVDYALNSWLSRRAGYRSLNFKYSASASNLGFNVHMRGPVFRGDFPVLTIYETTGRKIPAAMTLEDSWQQETGHD